MKEISTRSFLIITIFVAIISSTVFAALNSSIKSEALIDDAVSACAHTYNNSSATCTQAKKCTKCGYVAAKALGHTYNVAATCTKAKKCTRCGDVAVEALGHDYKYKSSITSHWRECIRCGNKLIAESHLYQSGINTCTEDKICITCGYVASEASGHTYNISLPTCTEAKKCTICGVIVAEALGHNYGDFIKTDPDSHWKVCSRCEHRYIFEPHLYESSTNNCEKNRKCMVCEYEVKASKHEYDISSATCSQAKICKNCGYVAEKATPHVYLKDDNYNGNVYVTSHTDFYKHWKVCSNCGAVGYVEFHLLNKDGYCSTCGYICEHKNESGSPTVEASSYEDKNETKHIVRITCTRCKKLVREEEENHDYVDGVCACGRKGKGNCKEHKFEDGVCINCGYECGHRKKYEKAENISKTQHTLKKMCKDCGMQVGKTLLEKHSLDDLTGMCEKCLYYPETICSHEWIGDTCDYCGIQCKHNGGTKDLYNKDLGTSTEHYRFPKCSICGTFDMTNGTYESHKFENGKCICGYECGHGKTYEKADPANKNSHTLKTLCENCDKEFSSKKTSHSFNEKGICEKCAYECKHGYGTNVTYESSGDEQHKLIQTCTNCKAITSKLNYKHNFSSGKCVCGDKCPHTKTKTELQKVEREEIHTEKITCNVCGHIETKSRTAITDFDATYTPTSDTTHKFSLMCKTCNFTYDGSDNCSFDMGTHKCAYCTNSLTKCKDKTHNHKLICDEGVTIPHTLYYYCDKYNLRWLATEKNQQVKNEFIAGLEFECEVCGEKIKYNKHKDCKQHQLSTRTKYENENVHIIQSVCEVCHREISRAEENHQFKSTTMYKNEIAHTIIQKCTVCGYEKTDERNHENLKQVNLMQATKEKHKLLMMCSECGTFRVEEEHIQNSQGKCTLCGFNLINSDEVIKATKLNISLSSKKLKVGEIIDLQDSLSVSPEGAKTNLQWSATNDNVTLKANGRLTANKAGSTTIKVTDTISGKTTNVNIKIESNKSTTSTETKNTTFTDVESDSWYNEVVQKATYESIFNGVTENEFAPNDYITRGMFVTALARVDKIDVAGYANLFSDVDDETYYADSIKWASIYGIVNGVGDGKFAPEELMTREEMAVMIHNYIDSQYKNVQLFNMSDDVNVSQFNDDDEISSWASVAVNELADMGIINGNENGNFAPKDNVTRAEAAAVLVRLSEKTKVN